MAGLELGAESIGLAAIARSGPYAVFQPTGFGEDSHRKRTIETTRARASRPYRAREASSPSSMVTPFCAWDMMILTGDVMS